MDINQQVHMVLSSAEFYQTAAPTLEDPGKYLYCIRKDLWRQDLIEKRAICMNDILIDQIIEVNIDYINLTDPHRTLTISALSSFPMHDNTHGRSAIIGNISLAKFDCLDNTICSLPEEAENDTLLSGNESYPILF